jgi:hypothetical protein
VVLTRADHRSADNRRWVTGSNFGLEIPADLESLLAGGPAFLTRAFRAGGVLAESHSVSGVAGAQEVVAGGTGKKFLLELRYDSPAVDLPEQLFVKFSRNFDNELWDRGRVLAISEVTFAVLSATPDFPVRVPRTLFADVDPGSYTGLIISERIPFGRDGLEPHYPKCQDYEMPDQLGHYQAILKGLAALAGAHRSGRLPARFDEQFGYDRAKALAPSGPEVPEAKAIERATRMFDFIERYPQLFPEHLRSSEFRDQFLRDVPDVMAAGESIRHLLHSNPDFIAFSHWNANIDNCWFWRGQDGSLECGFLDWANAGQLNVAQSILGSLGGAERPIWDDHLDELVSLYAGEFASHGGPQLDPGELRRQMLLSMASGFAWSMGAPLALERAFDDVGALVDHRDPRLRADDNARTQLHVMTRLLNVWQTRRLGDLVRSLEES